MVLAFSVFIRCHLFDSSEYRIQRFAVEKDVHVFFLLIPKIRTDRITIGTGV